MKNSLERKYYPNSIYIFFVTVGVRTSLRVSWLILRDPEVNDQVTLRIFVTFELVIFREQIHDLTN
jgi:hypothetical protein